MNAEKLSNYWQTLSKMDENISGYTFTVPSEFFDDGSATLLSSVESSAYRRTTNDDVVREICELKRCMSDDHARQNEQLKRIKELTMINLDLKNGLREALSLLKENSSRSFLRKLFVGYALLSVLLAPLFLFFPVKVGLLVLLAVMTISIAGFYIGGKMEV